MSACRMARLAALPQPTADEAFALAGLRFLSGVERALQLRWQAAGSPDEQRKLADELQQLLRDGVGTRPPDAPDSQLYQQLTSLGGPLMATAWRAIAAQPTPAEVAGLSATAGFSSLTPTISAFGCAWTIRSRSPMCMWSKFIPAIFQRFIAALLYEVEPQISQRAQMGSNSR